MTFATRQIYNPQLHHGGIPTIEGLSKLRHPAYGDTPYLQALAWSYWVGHRDLLLAAPFTPLEETRNQQFSRIAMLVDHAFCHVPFYQRLYGAVGYEPGALRCWADFEALPIIDKSTLAKADAADLMMTENGDQPSFETRSSGSSGVPFSTFLDTFDVVRDGSEFLRFFCDATDNRLGPRDWIYTIHHAGFWFTSLRGDYRIFQLIDVEDAESLAQHWAFLRPKVVSSLPSYLPKLADIGRLDRFGITAVTTNSEMSSRAERNRYSQIFGVPVVDEYSSEEVGFMASECLAGCYHVVEDGVYLEIVDADPSGTGRVVVTDLNNLLMPLIRYDHGDLARMSGKSCSCGRRNRVLSDLHGRRDDAFLTWSGASIPSASILALCDEHINDEDSGITSFRLVQRSPQRVELLYTRAERPLDDALRPFIEGLLQEMFGYAVEFVTTEVEALPVTGSEKRRSILRQFDGTK